MKKIMNTTCALFLVTATAVLFSCASAPKTGDATPVATAPISSKDQVNTKVDAYETKIVDWQDKGLGMKSNPEWLISLAVYKNPSKFLDMSGMADAYPNHHWFCVGVQNASKNTALELMNMEVLTNIAQEMYVSIQKKVGSSLTDGQKTAVANACMEVRADISGVGQRTTYWQLEKTTDEYGNTTRLYNYYGVYSCSLDKWNELQNIYFIQLLQNQGLEEKAKAIIKKEVANILKDGQEEQKKMVERAHQELREDEKEALAKEEREAERALKEALAIQETERTKSTNETRQKEAEERTAQVKSHNQAVSEVAASGANKAVASKSLVNPALAALLK